MTPVHKKGSKQELSNYRPVSCLPAAAKLLELVACIQTSLFMEENDLLPKTQHGFRQKRSTMSALSEVQTQWADNLLLLLLLFPANSHHLLQLYVTRFINVL